MYLASLDISVKFPALQGSHYLPCMSTFHSVGTSLALSREDEATGFCTNN